MKLCLFTDFRFASNPNPTGVSKHAYFMAKGLMADPRFRVSALVPSDQIGRQGNLDFLPATRLPLPWKVARELWSWTGHPVADQWVGDTDWVYCPKNDWIPVRKARYAVTIHGAHELDPDFSSKKSLMERALCLRTRLQYLKMCERADVVFTVSEWLKEFVIEQFHADENKIVVVGNGVDECFYEAGRMKVLKFGSSRVPKLDDGGLRTDVGSGSTSVRMDLMIKDLCPDAPPYILCVGGLNYIDGGDRIIALGQEIKRSGKRIRIKVAGCQHEPGAERLASETGVIDLLGYVPHEKLAEWMANASIFYFPTRYETFGMGAAEAMATGCPVVTNRCTAVPEIVGDCGLYVNPEIPGEVLECVVEMLMDNTSRQELVRRALMRSELFMWNRCVSRAKLALR